ncbi:MAG: Ig-like domain-containing protein, partial [Spirochaetia bacterium]|nr:Ig-like domain-containing protein [Spirochaetia bacterium]
WESSYKGIATIDSDGLITGVSQGKVHITGTTVDGGKKVDMILTVK